MSSSIFEQDLAKTPANFTPLSPLSFLRRTAKVFGDREAVVYGPRRYDWATLYARCRRLASAIAARGLGVGDTVSVIAANTPEMVEAHFGIPMAGAVLNAINTRLDADTIAYILGHGECKLLITDSQYSPALKEALEIVRGEGREIEVIDIVDVQAKLNPGEGERLGAMDYEAFLEAGDPEFDWSLPEDEWNAITLNYTSGTSGRPKGVVYHHRGAYLMAMGTATGWPLPMHPNYLYVVPMFHCNGWCHVWSVALMAGTIHCCRYIAAKPIFDAIADEKIAYFGGAPVVLGMLINAPESERRAFDHPVRAFTAGAPPPAAVLEKTQALGIDVMQVYGLTETYGHVTQCCWREEWDALDLAEQATIKARQGVIFPMMDDMRIVDPATGEDVPKDGQTMGEILLRGNCVMKGYLKNPDATAESFKGGYFHSQDLAVRHPGGYAEIRDRLKDIIISGGENVSSVEVEGVLYRHPAVLAAAVVAKADEKWGEVPCAFVELKPGATADQAEIIAFARQHLAGFKAPKDVRFGELPKTSTGKIQKFQLRSQVRDGK